MYYRHQNFDALIQHQIQALGFASFCQEKEESPSVASRGKPAKKKNSQFKNHPALRATLQWSRIPTQFPSGFTKLLLGLSG
ncbi:hypothetical protein, partial [Pseudomonas viridiflava]|uniref:hypothetical protein n=1 Tax=Pseudomonas viridiflava TaxID=33069 RepID=UPI00197DC812